MNKNDFALLDWHLRYVSDELWGTEAHNWFAKTNNETLALSLPTSSKPPSEKLLFGEPRQISEWLQIAEETSRKARSITDLKAAVEAFHGCEVRKFAKQTVFCDGKIQSRLLFIGEAPGEEEDRTGKPFVGESGLLLSSILSSINLDRRHDYLISNVFFWRPPGNRRPTNQELLLCRPFVLRLIALHKPDVIMTLGKTAAVSLFGTDVSITRVRGIWRDIKIQNGTTIPVLPSYHPAFLLRQPSRKAEIWMDMLTLKRKLLELSSAEAGDKP